MGITISEMKSEDYFARRYSSIIVPAQSDAHLLAARNLFVEYAASRGGVHGTWAVR